MYSSQPTSRTNAKLLLNYASRCSATPSTPSSSRYIVSIIINHVDALQAGLIAPIAAVAPHPELLALLRRHVLAADPLLTALDQASGTMSSDVLALFRAVYITPDDFGSDIGVTLVALRSV